MPSVIRDIAIVWLGLIPLLAVAGGIIMDRVGKRGHPTDERIAPHDRQDREVGPRRNRAE